MAKLSKPRAAWSRGDWGEVDWKPAVWRGSEKWSQWQGILKKTACTREGWQLKRGKNGFPTMTFFWGALGRLLAGVDFLMWWGFFLWGWGVDEKGWNHHPVFFPRVYYDLRDHTRWLITFVFFFKPAIPGEVFLDSYEYPTSRRFWINWRRHLEKKIASKKQKITHEQWEKETGWWFQVLIIFTPILGEMIQFEEQIFRMGWFNPPPRKSCPKDPGMS